MRKETVDIDWRIRLGERAKSLVMSVMPEDAKLDASFLEEGIAALENRALVAETRADTLEQANERLAALGPAIARMQQSTEEHYAHVFMLLGVTYRQLFSSRQIMALLTPDNKDVQSVIDKALDVLHVAEVAYRKIVPDNERRFADFDARAEDRQIARLMEEARTKQEDKVKGKGKDEERER